MRLSVHVACQQVQIIMTELGKMEDEIFKARYEKEQMFRRRDKERKKREKMKTPHWTPDRSSTTNGAVRLLACKYTPFSHVNTHYSLGTTISFNNQFSVVLDH